MPHIVVKSYTPFATPVQEGKFKFLWFAQPIKGKEGLVGVEFEGKEFILEIKPKNSNWIIKASKIVKPSPTTIIQNALQNFCKLAKCEISYHNLSSKPSIALKAKEFLKEVGELDFSKIAQQWGEVWIEVGFGSGRHLLYQAKKHPHILFFGIEIHKPSIEQLLKQIALEKLKNVVVIDYDARIFLELLPSNIVGKIFVHFPVPWDKKPHRRVISNKFIQESLRVLKPQGFLELRTDSENYFNYSLELFLKSKEVKLELEKNLEAEVRSKYEDRWRRLEKDIFTLRLFSLQSSPPKESDFKFDFKKLRYNDTILHKIDTSPKVYKDFFIHFERLYQIDKKTLLLKLSFGDFERPTHTYLLIDKKGATYFAKKPIPSQANILAHKKIEELLDE
ncbi:MAG: tRNA (guanosine(46)-N7)-methyltransferase TrmB [Epsilonproteobacteria bacterium]|nr:tRNA (guanosine(46)-N7)-methyltransferase TrmB [Campylobacterota bacterium]